jgi:hypothetical protein
MDILAVGLRPVGPGEAVADAELVAGQGELVAAVAAAVVGEDESRPATS